MVCACSGNCLDGGDLWTSQTPYQGFFLPKTHPLGSKRLAVVSKKESGCMAKEGRASSRKLVLMTNVKQNMPSEKGRAFLTSWPGFSNARFFFAYSTFHQHSSARFVSGDGLS